MAITALEIGRKLVLDLGDGLMFEVPPVPGKIGLKMTGILVGVAFGATLERAEEESIELAQLAMGSTLPGWEEREELYQSLRSSEQMKVAQAAILWNTQGGSIEAVQDLLESEEGTGYPKALGRVMRSCGLGQQYEVLRTWLSGESANRMRADSMPAMTFPSGISNINNGETSPEQAPEE